MLKNVLLEESLPANCQAKGAFNLQIGSKKKRLEKLETKPGPQRKLEEQETLKDESGL